MYSRDLAALAFAADFPPDTPKFNQRTLDVRLTNCVHLTKNHLAKSGAARFREYINMYSRNLEPAD